MNSAWPRRVLVGPRLSKHLHCQKVDKTVCTSERVGTPGQVSPGATMNSLGGSFVEQGERKLVDPLGSTA